MNYWDTYHKLYMEVNKRSLSQYYEKYKIPAIAPFLPDDKDARLIDIGCGAGLLLNYLLKKGYFNLEGIDILPGQIEFAKEKIGDRVKLSVENARVLVMIKYICLTL